MIEKWLSHGFIYLNFAWKLLLVGILFPDSKIKDIVNLSLKNKKPFSI